MNTNNNKEFYQKAMYYGTLLGGVWSVMYLLLFACTANSAAIMLCMSLFLASPFIAAMFATKYRKKECNNAMSYVQAWIFLFYMYICASLLSSLALLVYFKFFDGGTFLMTIQEMFAETMKLPGVDATLIQQIEQTMKLLEQVTSTDLVWQLMSNNFMNATIIPLIIAIFVKKK